MDDTISALVTAALFLREGAGFNLTASQRLALLVVAEQPGRQISEVAERARLTAVDVSKAIRELERVGLVRLELDDADRRRKHVYLSDLGEHLVSELLAATGLATE